jgi:hypothetical protein
MWTDNEIDMMRKVGEIVKCSFENAPKITTYQGKNKHKAFIFKKSKTEDVEIGAVITRLSPFSRILEFGTGKGPKNI